jgi:hypothetical protein
MAVADTPQAVLHAVLVTGYQHGHADGGPRGGDGGIQ